MHQESHCWYSNRVEREMRVNVYGHAGTPVLAVPCQDGMSNNWEAFGMIANLADYIEEGRIQVFCMDTVDCDSWSAQSCDPAVRADVQESYFEYVVEEVLPLVRALNGSGRLPLVCGMSLGATQAAVLFLRRPDLFGGVVALSGVYDTDYFWGDWMNPVLYRSAPLRFLPNMPADHPYIDLYNARPMVFCVGQGAYEDEGRRTLSLLRDIFREKGVNACVDFWGYDVNHDWPWWFRQMRHFLPQVLD